MANNPVHAHFQKLAHIRDAVPALRKGRFRTWVADENGLYAYLRETDDQRILCAVNTGLKPIAMRIPLPDSMKALKVLHDLYSGKTLNVEDGMIRVQLEVGEGVILQ